MPRDRKSEFEPQVVKKGQKDIIGFRGLCQARKNRNSWLDKEFCYRRIEFDKLFN